MCECVCYCAYFYYVIKLYVHVCVLERAKHSFFALPNPLSCSVMNKICLNQNLEYFLFSILELCFVEDDWGVMTDTFISAFNI